MMSLEACCWPVIFKSDFPGYKSYDNKYVLKNFILEV